MEPSTERAPTSVYQRALGADFERLAPELRGYFAHPDAGHVGRGTGVFEVAGSPARWMLPVLAYFGWRRILFPEFGRDVPFVVTNTPGADGSLGAVRTLSFPNRDRSMEDTMRIVDGRLHDFLGRRRGLEARFRLHIVDGALTMTSDRLWLNLAGLRIRMPRFATVTVTEAWRDASQHVDVRLTSPLLGEWFSYRGSFSYRPEAP